MKIIFDPIIFLLQRYGGISRYYSEIIKILSSKNEFDIEFPLYYSDNLHVNNYNLGKNSLIRKYSKLVPFRYKERLKKKSVHAFIERIEHSNFDLIIPTYFDTSFLEYKREIPFVLTVYDMIHENYPELEKGSSIVSDKKVLIESADAIIAISEYTKRDILKLYPHVSESKISVVHLSHSIVKKEVRAGLLTQLVADYTYILFVGNRGFYKNFEWFLPVVSGWLLANNVKLLCLGGGGFNESETQMISNFGLSEYVTQYTFQDDELYAFYKSALAFVFPSEYEGFGIPILEAMYSGCPVLLPKLTSFPEVAGDAGEYFDLADSNSLIDSLDKLKNDSGYRDRLVKSGFVQASKFSWEMTVEKCLNVYNSVVLK